MGESINATSRGVHLVITDSVSPFAVGKFTGPAIEIYLKSEKHRLNILRKYRKQVMSYIDEDDVVEALQQHSKSKNPNRRILYPDFENITEIYDFIWR